MKNFFVQILTVSSQLMNTFLNYVEKQAKHYILLYIFQVIKIKTNLDIQIHLDIVHLSGCYVIGDITIRLTVYKKGCLQ